MTDVVNAMLDEEFDKVKELLEKGANANSKDKVADDSLIIIAARKNQLELVKLLILKGANINDANAFGKTPLHYAVVNENVEMIKFLIDLGANLEARDEEEKTPIFIASWLNTSFEVLKVLVDSGANVNAKNERGETPLHYLAIDCDRPEFFELLIENGADVNARDNEGNTPLHFAVSEHNLTAMPILMKHGANPLIKNSKRKSPCSMTRSKKVKKILECEKHKSRKYLSLL